jgi:hypothetical protein
MQLSALGDADGCANNPCDPYCQAFDEEPDVPYVATGENTSGYDWVQGGLEDYPPGLVSKGLIQPCESSGDCQFNTQCMAPSAGSCSHSVCVDGDALEAGCSDCTERICAEHPECCASGGGDGDGDVEDLDTRFCNHDPCVKGKGLAAGCNGCVAAICETNPSCCNTWGSNWTQACVDAVVTSCGNSCGCDDDETAYAGSCYHHETKNYDWFAAHDKCEDRGAGWGLVTINDADENAMVAGIAPSKEKFIGFEEDSGQWTWVGAPGLGTHDEWSVSGPLYTSWKPGQPSPISGWSDVDCAFMDNGGAGWVGENACDSNSSSDKRDSVCEGPVSTMQAGAGLSGGGPSGPGAWSPACVERVGTLCGATCDEDDPEATLGQCVTRLPGDTDPSCAGVDLAVGVPCTGVIPVCNHGQTTALPPIEVMHFPANSQQIPTCVPGLDHPGRVTCTVTQPIAPGECVSVDADSCVDAGGAAAPLHANREIMVNPNSLLIDTAGGMVEECDCLDNWSIYSHGSADCAAPTCAGGSSAATQTEKPVDIIIIIDNSPSMDDEIAEVQARIHTDLAQILDSSGLDYRVIMISRFGDVTKAVGTSTTPICIGPPLGGNACTDPSNETLVLGERFFHHSTDIESWDSWCQLLGGFDKPDEVGVTDAAVIGVGSTRPWTPLAMDGWRQWLRSEAFKTFLVITDDDIECTDYGYNFDDTPGCNGFPQNCHNLATQTSNANTVAAGETAAQNFDDALLALSPEQFGTADERNYVWHSIVNLRSNPAGATTAWGPEAAIQTKMCTPAYTQIVGAGTGYQALSRLTGGLRYPICQKNDFDAIFNTIASAVVETSAAGCEFNVPSGDEIDADAATVSYTEGDGVNVPLQRRGSLADCGGATTAWYYDDPTEPSRLSLCPATCSVVQADSGAQVWVEFGCLSVDEPSTYQHEYEATCPIGHLPQWSFMAYDTTIIGDGTVSFRARTADSQAGLETATWHTLGTAIGAAPDCPMAPSGGCPIDLWQTFGEDEAKNPHLELEFTVTPSSLGESPSVLDWEVRFSCPAGE